MEFPLSNGSKVNIPDADMDRLAEALHTRMPKRDPMRNDRIGFIGDRDPDRYDDGMRHGDHYATGRYHYRAERHGMDQNNSGDYETGWTGKTSRNGGKSGMSEDQRRKAYAKNTKEMLEHAKSILASKAGTAPEGKTELRDVIKEVLPILSKDDVCILLAAMEFMFAKAMEKVHRIDENSENED